MTMPKEAKCLISMQNYTFEVAIIIILLSWQFSLHSGKKEAIGEAIAIVHSPSISVFEFKWYVHACVHINIWCSIDFLYDVNVYSGIQLKELSSLCFMFIKHLNSGILFLNTTHVRVLTDVLVVLRIIARYAAYRKLSLLVKALPKLVLYGKYGTQRVVLKQNIALIVLYLSLTHSFRTIFST